MKKKIWFLIITIVEKLNIQTICSKKVIKNNV